ncbi:DNA methyltransferase [Helicobacter vulpis]|uniref:DNA methyltransferase n=1 Tax=Helicobacter vulpis TaxID=2316076 RepID=UPI000EADD3FA|nr:site-specific DNA-methyltransferase [Helicobacter vulpis]
MQHKVFMMDALDCLARLESQSVQTIYIDPPYNTRGAFEYHDCRGNYEAWIKEHLQAARRVLKSQGCLFVSIDDHKMAALKLILDSIYGAQNFLGVFITKQATRSNAKHINTIHEYVLSYAKDKSKAPPFESLRVQMPMYQAPLNALMRCVKDAFKKHGQQRAQEILKQNIATLSQQSGFRFLKNYNLVDCVGEIYFAKDLSTPSAPREVHLAEIGLFLAPLKSRGWCSDAKFKALYHAGKLVFRNKRPYEKHYLRESKDKVLSVLDFYSRQGTKDLERLGLGNVFKAPKPVALIKYLISCCTPKNSIVLDFFAGSGTSAQAVLELNAQTDAQLCFCLCQNKEPIRNNPHACARLRAEGLEPHIANIMRLRLQQLKTSYSLFENTSPKTPCDAMESLTDVRV